MTKAEVQEALVTLYLRLNGYFTSGFVVHSAVPGQNITEVDVLAVRLPNNAERVREVQGAPELDRWDGGTDFIIGEVKSHAEPKQFNTAVRNAEAVSTILQWWGHLNSNEVALTTPDVLQILQPLPGIAAAPTVLCARDARVRAILFAPETRNRRPEQAWYIPGPPIMAYVWKCLHPTKPREECATNYGAGQWGVGLAPLVAYFKDPARVAPGGFDDLLVQLGVQAD